MPTTTSPSRSSRASSWHGSGRSFVGRAAPAQSASTSAFFDLVIDPGAREVRRGETPVALTRVEFDLLAALTDRPGIVLTREQLGALVFGESFDAYDRTIDSHVKNLRHKLGPRPDGQGYIETARGDRLPGGPAMSLRLRLAATFAFVALITAAAVALATPTIVGRGFAQIESGATPLRRDSAGPGSRARPRCRVPASMPSRSSRRPRSP